MEYQTPKNRKETRLDILDIEIESFEGIHKFDPNTMARVAYTGDYPDMLPVPKLKSEISFQPAYLVRVDNIELALSFQELDRFFRHALRKREVKYLLKTYGMFHDIHEDFYWEGTKQQPMSISVNARSKIKFDQKIAESEKMKKKLENELKNKKQIVLKYKI
jgi:hypothetical protein